MFGRGKKPVSLAYKEKLLADIAYYEKRIEEALHKRIHNSPDEVASADEDSNPYTVNIGPFPMELKREEARLSNCASMTLELAMLTIMQSEVNVMATTPDIRRPVEEDGTWLEVAAECKIDLVSFTISIYAHKPHRKFAPSRFRNLQVNLTKAAHEKELAQSVLPKLNRPNLALQVLQSYATAFRSRRTTLLELAETYADRLNMEAMPGGGYRVKFLELLTVEWTLENMWSPVVPFCHRMKFEVEYMPKHYIHAISKLYKQFKDPSLETSERTRILARIFDICSEARGPARDLHDAFESDPETAGRLHERRTTIDQEPDVPSNCEQNVELSPHKQPKGKENKAQNRKTTMAPPKSLPKKAKKATNVNNKAKDLVDDVAMSKTNERVSDDGTKTYPNDNNAIESRKAVKRAIENEATSYVKKMKTVERNGAKSSGKVSENDNRESTEPNVSSKGNDQKKSSSKTVVKNADVNPKNDITTKNTDAGKGANLNKRTEVINKNAAKKVGGDKKIVKSKEIDGDVAASKNKAKETLDAESVAISKSSMRKTANDGENVASAKEQGTKGSVANSKNSKKAEDGKSVSSKNASEKDSVGGGSSKDSNKKVNDNKNKAPSKNLKVTTSNANTKNKNSAEKVSNKHEKVKNFETVEKNKVNNEKAQNDNDKEKISKAPTKDKAVVQKKTDIGNNLVANQNEVHEITEKSVKAKQSADKVSKSNNKNKESQKRDAVKDKVTNIKNAEKKTDQETETVKNNVQKVNKNKESVSQKINKPISEATDTKNVVNRKSAVTVAAKPKGIINKVGDAKENNKNEGATSNRNAAVVNSKMAAKFTINNVKNHNQNKDDKFKNINAKAVPEITKSNVVNTNVQTEKPIHKIIENQAKVAEKLKTRIPMMKNKLKIGALNNKLGKSEGKFGKNTEKTKIPLKSLPVFKKIAKNFPTRMSPRKLPSIFKPSSHGISNK